MQSARKFVTDIKEFRRSGGTPYYIPDPDLGWTIAPNTSHFSRPYTSDAQGFRLTKANTSENGSCTVVSIWGDSMVHGDGVADSNSWPWILSEILSDRFKVINGGVSGYGSDQGLLRFKNRVKQVKPDIALLSYATADLFRHVNIYRTFLHHGGLLVLAPQAGYGDSPAGENEWFLFNRLLEETETPEPGPNQVRIRVAVAVIRTFNWNVLLCSAFTP